MVGIFPKGEWYERGNPPWLQTVHEVHRHPLHGPDPGHHCPVRHGHAVGSAAGWPLRPRADPRSGVRVHHRLRFQEALAEPHRMAAMEQGHDLPAMIFDGWTT